MYICVCLYRITTLAIVRQFFYMLQTSSQWLHLQLKGDDSCFMGRIEICSHAQSKSYLLLDLSLVVIILMFWTFLNIFEHHMTNHISHYTPHDTSHDIIATLNENSTCRSSAAHIIAKFTKKALLGQLPKEAGPSPSHAVIGAYLYICRQLYNTCEGLLVLYPYELHRFTANAYRDVCVSGFSVLPKLYCKMLIIPGGVIFAIFTISL